MKNINNWIVLCVVFFLVQGCVPNSLEKCDQNAEAGIESRINYMDTLVKVPFYQQGKELCSCASNMEYLFDAWPIERIDNASDLKLISYTYLGKIEDQNQIDLYAALMTTPDSPFPSTAGSYSNNQKRFPSESQSEFFYISCYRDVLDTVSEEDRVLAQSIEKELSDMRTGLASILKVGYKVFSINLEFGGRPFESFVFCDPETCEVVIDMLFMNL